MNINSFNILSPFVEAVERHPTKIALIQGDQQVSYAALMERVQKKAAYFVQKGIHKGDRVLVFVPMSIELYETVLALFYLGAVAVFLDEWVNRERLNICCRMAGCKGFIAPRKIRWLCRTSKEIRKIPVWLKTKKYAGSVTGIALTQESDPALVTFTTGSTGIPKAANRTHGFLREQFKALLSEIRPTPNDVDLPTLPIVLLMNLGAGCTSVIASFSSARPEKTDFGKIVDKIKKHAVNRMESSPDFASRLSTYLLEKKISLPGMRSVFTGGAPVFPKEAELMNRAFPQAGIHIVYGSTEAEPVSLIDAATLSKSQTHFLHALPVGKIYQGARVLIIPIKDEPLSFASTKELENAALLAGQVGEIIVSGPHVLSAYLNNPQAEQRNKVWVEGICWHRTGDSGLKDENENLFLCGRCSMIFEKNGRVYYPFTVEQLVRESGISPIGTVMLANGQVIVFAEGKKEQARHLQDYLTSKGIIFDRLVMLEKIPRDKRHFSKIEYSVLK